MHKIWTKNVTCISLSHLLLQLSTLILLPVLPFIIQKQIGGTLLESALIMSVFAISLFVVGPFLSFLTEKFYRKRLALFSLLLLTISTISYMYVNTIELIILLRVLQGLSSGIAISELTTLSIDVTTSGQRDKVNLMMHNAHRIALAFSPIIVLGLYYLFPKLGNDTFFQDMLYISAGCSGMSLLLLLPVTVFFRAPLATQLLSLDRFLLCKGWGDILLILGLSILLGLVYALFPLFDHRVFQGLFMFVFSGLLILGVLIIIRFVFLDVIKQCDHCQRSTANTTFYLAWEIGLALGIIVGYAF